MLPTRHWSVAGAARRDHDGYSDTPGRPVLPDGGTLPRLAHAWGVDGPPGATGVLSRGVPVLLLFWEQLKPKNSYKYSHSSCSS